jgi:hypothetical protein
MSGLVLLERQLLLRTSRHGNRSRQQNRQRAAQQATEMNKISHRTTV